MLYWCLWPQFLVRGPQLAAQVSHCWHHFSTSFLAWSQEYLWRTLSSILLTPKWPSDGPPSSSVSTSFPLLRGRTIWATYDRPSADSVAVQCGKPYCEGFPLGPVNLYVGRRLVMSFHSRRCPASTSSRMGPTSGLFSCSLREAGSHQAVASAAIARTCLMSACASTFWQWIHSSQHGCREKASALLCFCPRR
jgi:hypothetical protein